MTEGEGGQPQIASCTEGEKVTLDIRLTTLLNATGRYDSLIWIGENGQNPRGTLGTCYLSSLPGDPDSPFILDLELDGDQCNDTNSSGTLPVDQYLYQVELDCIDQYTPDPNGNDPDDVLPVPDGQLDVFVLVTWFQNNTLNCGIGPGQAMEPGVNPKCDASILTGINVEVLESATIQVVKNSSGGTHQFGFTTDIPGLSPGFTLDTTGDNTDSTAVIQLGDAEVGVTYNITEAVPAGWSLASATCSNGDTPDAVTPLDGQDVICTFNDVALGSVTVVKNTVGGDGSFDFTSDLPGGNFNIATAANTGMYSVNNVPAGTYSIAETVPAGWNLDSATCSDGSPPDALVLSDGETVTCTFVDTELGTIIVEKQTLPDGSPQTFDFSGDAVGTIGDGGTITINNLLPAQYTSTETIPAGWALSSIICDDVESLTPSTGDTGTATATFNLDAGETVTCTFTNTQDGSIEVVKNLSATGPAVETFGFTSSFNGAFSLTGHGDTTGPIAVTPGAGYTVSEDDPTADGWANVSATCTGGDDPTANITVSPGEAVVCTFTNTPLGSATIVKNTVGGDGTFDFVGDPPFNGLQLTTVAGTASEDFTYELLAGQYTATEDPVPAGWTLTNVGCVEDIDQDSSAVIPTATLDVELAETVTCTFTNTADGTLIIRKETIPDGLDVPFTFTGDAAGAIRDYSVYAEELSVSGQPGIYSSAEIVPAGWDLTDISCTGMTDSTVDIGVGTAAFEPGDSNVEVDLAAGETVICTFENTAVGSITIEKLTGGGTGLFTFNTDFDGSFQLDTSGDNPDGQTFSNLLPGSYMFSEVIPTNWSLASISCEGNEASTVTIGGANGFDPGDTSVTIDLVDGEAITCSFTNVAWGNIVVDKVTDPQGSAQSFDFTSSYGAPFSLTDGDTPNDSGPLPPSWPAGTYSVTEGALPVGWSLTDANCTDGEVDMAPDNITLPAGGTVTCTFTNTIDRGNIIVDKVTDPAGSAQSFAFTLTGTDVDLDFALTDADTPYDSGDLLPTSENGTYNVAETVPAGWDLTSAVCSDGSPANAVDLAPDETVTCTFTNTIQPGNIIVDKVTDPVGSAQSFAFTLTGTGVDLGFALTDAATPYDSGDLLPTSENGTYNVAETVPAGWDLTSAICSDASPANAVDLAPGETVTCTFTNTLQRASITIVKQLVGLPDGEFCFTVVGPEVDTGFCILTSGGTGSDGDDGLLPGLYSFNEILDGQYYPASTECSNGDSADAVDLGPGDDVTCTFVNVPVAPVPVNNTLALLLLTLMLLATGWYFRPAGMRS